MTLDERIPLLQAMPFFGAIDKQSVSLILELSETIQAGPGDLFFQQGELGDSLFILERGEAIIFKTHANDEFVLRTIKAGDCFGDLALIDCSQRSASVRANTHCQAIKISASVLHELYKQNIDQYLLIQMNIARELSRRVKNADERWFQMQVSNQPKLTA